MNLQDLVFDNDETLAFRNESLAGIGCQENGVNRTCLAGVSNIKELRLLTEFLARKM